ncbi:MAG: hypothetical protein U1C33_07815, partial [Candidatus Cloacimonadaceae bacterium]|nr:hypothetical protein [Candidatus Cloacimonadaceae bacterium]
AGADNGPAVIGLGDVIELNGTWYSMMTQYGLNYNWNLAGYFDDGRVLSHNGSMLNIPVANTPTRDINLRDLRLSTASGNNSSRVLRGFNVYRDSALIAGMVPTTTYLDELLPVASYSYTVQAVYYTQNSAMSDPVIAEILPPVPIALPFTEDWASGNFTANNWVSGGTNWSVTAGTGLPAPSAQFSWNPQITNYSVPLTSDNLGGVGINSITLSYDLGLNNYSYNATNYMTVQIWDGAIWQTVANHVSDDYAPGSTIWGSHNVDISAHAANRVFKLRFLANGEDSYEINQWYVDNITVQESVTELDAPVITEFLANPDGDDWDYIAWTAVPGATWYAVYASDDPYGTFDYLGWTPETDGWIPFLSNPIFFKVTAGTGDLPRGQELTRPARAIRSK